MGKKLFKLQVALLLLLTISIPCEAQEISVEAAQKTAAKFINEHGAKLPAKSRKGMMKAPPKAESLQLVYTLEDQLHESPALYVFQQPKLGGFVIASADERAYPILGYNENGAFREDSLPCCLKFIIEEYGRQIAEARKQNLPRHTENAENESWDNIEPLLTCAWDQHAPFNNLCPVDINTGERCLTGCVATSMAQIMYYWKWPEQGVGNYSYQTDNIEGILTANFGETTYRWDLMKDDYFSTDDPENAVATLMYHCGVALNMIYGSEGSYAGSIVEPLKNYFKYSNIIKYTENILENQIYNELLHKRPIEILGNGIDDAHSYICDGYRTDGFFHFNLGWGPYHNGYYKMNSVNGYNSTNATIHIAPRKELVDHYGNIYETLDDKAYLLKGGDVSAHLEIPAQVTSSNGTKFPVVEISSNAFNGHTSITSVIIPNTVTSIGEGAFRGCSGLTSVTIGNSVTSIGNHAFFNCSGLTSVTIPNSVTSIGYGAFFKCSGLTSINIPNSVTSIGEDAFCGCSGLTSITIPNSVTSIGKLAFFNCSGLESIIVENGNTVYDSRENCNAIIETATNTLIAGCKNTVIPNSVTSIGEDAFYGCIGLTSVTIPNSVKSIGWSAFAACYGLTSVISLIEEPFEITDNVFYNYNEDTYSNEFTSATLYVPAGTKEKYESTPAWNKFKNIVEGIENAVESVETDAKAEETERYNIGGQRISSPQKGLNIVKMSGGTTRKVMCK